MNSSPKLSPALAVAILLLPTFAACGDDDGATPPPVTRDGGPRCAPEEHEQGLTCLPAGVYVRGNSFDAGSAFHEWSGAGTPDEPTGTLEEAIEIAEREGLDTIFICSEYREGFLAPVAVYHEAEIDGLTSDLRISGKYDCSRRDGWRASDELANLRLKVRNSSAKLTVSDTRVHGAPVALFLEDSTDVVLENVVVDADSAEAGSVRRFRFAFDFEDAEYARSSRGCEMLCPDGSMTVGGMAGTDAVPPTSGLPERNGGSGRNGGDGPDGADGRGAIVWGRVVDGSWQGEPGEFGAHGGTGQGGEGGLEDGGSGYGGACGGCGGAGGTPGSAGESSIGVLSVRSGLTIRNSTIETSDATDGARGWVGQEGQGSGPVYSPGVSVLRIGGYGGEGGTGGAGGGGAGGISVGILHEGAAPTLEEVSISVGVAGHGGVGGIPLTNDGVEGIAGDIVQLPSASAPACVGAPDACAGTTDLDACDLIPGCSANRECQLRDGETGDCRFGDRETCEGFPRCVWGSCEGTPLWCPALPETTCGAVPGCTPGS